MYFAFIDEAGTTHQKDKDNFVYVYTALIIHEKGWKFLHKETVNLKQQIWSIIKEKDDEDDPPDKFEIHLKEITNRSGYYEKLKEIDENFTLSILSMIYGLISKLFAKIISVIIIKEEFYKQYSEGLDEWAFKLLVERINRYVTEKDTENEEFAILVIDSAGDKIDNERRKQIENYMKHGTGVGWKEYPERVIETPFAVKSNIHSGVQLVDSISYLIKSYTRKCLGINPDSFFNRNCDNFMKQIVQMFYGYDFDSENKYVIKDGIKFFPTSTQIPNNFWEIF